MSKIAMIIATGLLMTTGCTTAATDRMDTFFNSLNRPRDVQPDPNDYKNKPGYAPAYPAFDRNEPDEPFFNRDMTPEPTRLY